MDLALGTTGLQGGDIKASVMLNNGTGNFVTSNFGTGLGIPQGLVLGDFNSDGKPDMASTTYNTSFVRIFFNNGAGGFGQSNVDIPFTSQGQAPLTRAPFTADVNKDGKVDLLISTPGTNGLQVLIGDGAGGFTQAAPISLGGIFALITVSDLNGDGNDDLLLGGASSLTPLGVKLGDGSGGFGAPIVSTGINFLSTAVIADYDGDGKLDLAAPSNVTIGSPPSTFPALVVMSGDGTGRFTRKTTLSMSQPGVGGFTGGDFNRDGKADVAFVWGSTRVTALFGDGIGGLGSPIDTDTGGNSQFPGNGGLVAADFNGDGRPDLAAANYTIGAKVLLSTCPAASVSLSISDVNVIEGNSGTTNAVFNVSLSAPSAQTVSVSYETIDGTGFSTNDYVGSSGSVTFTPGQTEKTITVPVNGDTIVESNDSFFVNLFNPTNATFTKTLGTATILNDDGQTPVQLLMEDSVSPPNQLAAIDAIVFVKGPFHVLSIAQWLQVGSDQNTRVVIFAKNLQLNQGETAAAVEINLANGNYTNTIFAEDVRPVANTDFAQVTFRLPNNLPSGICAVSVRLRGQVSNSGTIHIVP